MSLKQSEVSLISQKNIKTPVCVCAWVDYCTTFKRAVPTVLFTHRSIHRAEHVALLQIFESTLHVELLKLS